MRPIDFQSTAGRMIAVQALTWSSSLARTDVGYMRPVMELCFGS